MYVPAVLEVTFTEIVQVVPAGRVPFEKAIDVPPAATLSTPPQVLVKERGVSITSPGGKMSVKARPVRGVAVLLLVMIKVKSTGELVEVGVPGSTLVKTGEVGPTTRVTVPLCAGAWELVRVTGGLT
jgi:hypothetical protein